MLGRFLGMRWIFYVPGFLRIGRSRLVPPDPAKADALISQRVGRVCLDLPWRVPIKRVSPTRIIFYLDKKKRK